MGKRQPGENGTRCIWSLQREGTLGARPQGHNQPDAQSHRPVLPVMLAFDRFCAALSFASFAINP